MSKCTCGDEYCDTCNPFLILSVETDVRLADQRFATPADGVEIAVRTTRGDRTLFVSTDGSSTVNPYLEYDATRWTTE